MGSTTLKVAVAYLVLSFMSVAYANTSTGLPGNLFEYGFAGAGYLILGYFCYRLLNMVKEQAEDYKVLITNNTKAMEELKSAIEGKLLGK